ncbi:MAG: heparinase [Lachnospiraceae bacterium]|nr:heparinase [Lachnospiraceae bacterium]
MFIEFAKNYSDSLTSFSPYPPASDRNAYENLSEDLKTQIIKEGERYLNYSYPSLPITVFMSFLRTGNRVDFENIYFARRYAFNALVMAECVEYKGRFLDDIINGVFTICEESAWQLPPHNSYKRGGANELLPDPETPVLDLFACETGALLSVCYYLLKDALNTVHPFINKRILSEISRRIVTPYLTMHFWWMGNGDEPMCNWTVWCVQNCLLTIFLTDQPDEIKEKAFHQSLKSIDCFLKDYGEDGCCDEGAQYYHHAGLCLFNAMEVLNGITNHFFAPLYQNPKIRNIASYIQNVHVSGPYFLNFADCSPVAGRCSAREYLFAKRIQNPDMMRFAATDFKESEEKLLSGEINLFYHLQHLFTYDEMMHYSTTSPVSYPDLYYQSVGLFIARDNRFVLAAKAGDNNDSHNHNDTGSITVYQDGKPLLIDLGVETYCAKTFSDKRYEIWTMQSSYHNLPAINGYMQLPGAAYKATDVHPFFSHDTCSITMDLAAAYPKEAGLLSYIRTVTLRKNHVITLEDHWTLAPSCSHKNSVILSLMTYEKPSLHPDSIQIGTLSTITISTTGSSAFVSSGSASLPISSLSSIVSMEEIPITDARLQTAWKHSIHRILLTPPGNQIKLTILPLA